MGPTTPGSPGGPTGPKGPGGPGGPGMVSPLVSPPGLPGGPAGPWSTTILRCLDSHCFNTQSCVDAHNKVTCQNARVRHSPSPQGSPEAPSSLWHPRRPSRHAVLGVQGCLSRLCYLLVRSPSVPKRRESWVHGDPLALDSFTYLCLLWSLTAPAHHPARPNPVSLVAPGALALLWVLRPALHHQALP